MKPTPAQIEAAAKALHSEYQWDVSKNASYWEQLAKAALTAAVEVGPQGKGPWVSSECWNSERNATIERCAQRVEEIFKDYVWCKEVAAAIRKLKDEA